MSSPFFSCAFLKPDLPEYTGEKSSKLSLVDKKFCLKTDDWFGVSSEITVNFGGSTLKHKQVKVLSSIKKETRRNINLLNPRSDQHLISLNSTTAESFIKSCHLITIKEMTANFISFDC